MLIITSNNTISHKYAGMMNCRAVLISAVSPLYKHTLNPSSRFRIKSNICRERHVTFSPHKHNAVGGEERSGVEIPDR